MQKVSQSFYKFGLPLYETLLFEEYILLLTQ